MVFLTGFVISCWVNGHLVPTSVCVITSSSSPSDWSAIEDGPASSSSSSSSWASDIGTKEKAMFFLSLVLYHQLQKQSLKKKHTPKWIIFFLTYMYMYMYMDTILYILYLITLHLWQHYISNGVHILHLQLCFINLYFQVKNVISGNKNVQYIHVSR